MGNVRVPEAGCQRETRAVGLLNGSDLHVGGWEGYVRTLLSMRQAMLGLPRLRKAIMKCHPGKTDSCQRQTLPQVDGSGSNELGEIKGHGLLKDLVAKDIYSLFKEERAWHCSIE